MNWFKSRWKIISCIVLAVLLLGMIARCSERPPPIEGTAVIIGFNYSAYNNRNVSFSADVIGTTAYGEEVVRRWSISSLQFQQLEIGDNVRRVGGRVIRLDGNSS